MLPSQSITPFPLEIKEDRSLDAHTYLSHCLLPTSRTYLQPLLHNREDPLHSHAEPHTRHLAPFRVKHAHQSIIAPSSSDTAHTHGLFSFPGWGMQKHSLIDHPSIVVQTSGKAQVKGDL